MVVVDGLIVMVSVVLVIIFAVLPVVLDGLVVVEIVAAESLSVAVN